MRRVKAEYLERGIEGRSERIIRPRHHVPAKVPKPNGLRHKRPNRGGKHQPPMRTRRAQMIEFVVGHGEMG